MPLSAYILLITLAPAVCGVLIVALGLARRAVVPAALALAVVGALIAAVGTVLLAPAMDPNLPFFFTLFGGTISAWFGAAYRIDAFGLYAALGITLVVAPLLLWMAWQRGSAASAEDELEVAAVSEVAGTVEIEEIEETEGPAATQGGVGPAIWGGLALALGLESVALTLVFADNVLWLALAWV
ncbi:MAG: hypothetical protein ACHQ4H_18925, partial [Ktedonobacterales bacterium]